MSATLPSLQELMALGPKGGAAFWLERLPDEAPENEEALFSDWLAASEANSAAWDDALALWESFEFAEGNEDLARMRQEALTFRPRRFSLPPVSTPWVRYAAAASVAILVSAGVLVNMTDLFGGQPSRQVAVADKPEPGRFGVPDYQTGVGKRATVALSDGSTLTLDTDSAVDIAYQADKRLVKLVRGQVFFDVAHNAERPFSVAAGERIVTVLGTRFNIRVSRVETRVLLVEGSIGVSKGTDPGKAAPEFERLAPGQQLIARQGQPDEITKVEGEPGLEWRTGFIQFDGQTIAAAIEELNRYTKQKLLVRDPKVAALRISGAFPTGDTRSFVQTLTALYPVKVIPAAGGMLEIVSR